MEKTIKQIVESGKADEVRKEIYEAARTSKLTTAHIVTLKHIRNVEAKLHTELPRPTEG